MTELVVNNMFCFNYNKQDKDEYIHFITDMDCSTKSRLSDYVSPTASQIFTSDHIEKHIRLYYGAKNVQGVRLHRRVVLTSTDKKKQYCFMFFDSKYSTGSVAVLIEGDFGRVFYTGNFAYYPNILTSAGSDFILEKPINILYLDGMFYGRHSDFDGYYTIVTKIVNLITSTNRRILFFAQKHLLDQLVANVAQKLSEKVCVSQGRYDIMKTLKREKYFTTDRKESRIIVKSSYVASREKDVVIYITRFSRPQRFFMKNDKCTLPENPALTTVSHISFYYYAHMNHRECLRLISELSPKNVVFLNTNRNGETELLEEMNSTPEVPYLQLRPPLNFHPGRPKVHYPRQARTTTRLDFSDPLALRPSDFSPILPYEPMFSSVPPLPFRPFCLFPPPPSCSSPLPSTSSGLPGGHSSPKVIDLDEEEEEVEEMKTTEPDPSDGAGSSDPPHLPFRILKPDEINAKLSRIQKLKESCPPISKIVSRSSSKSISNALKEAIRKKNAEVLHFEEMRNNTHIKKLNIPSSDISSIFTSNLIKNNTLFDIARASENSKNISSGDDVSVVEEPNVINPGNTASVDKSCSRPSVIKKVPQSRTPSNNTPIVIEESGIETPMSTASALIPANDVPLIIEDLPFIFEDDVPVLIEDDTPSVIEDVHSNPPAEPSNSSSIAVELSEMCSASAADSSNNLPIVIEVSRDDMPCDSSPSVEPPKNTALVITVPRIEQAPLDSDNMPMKDIISPAKNIPYSPINRSSTPKTSRSINKPSKKERIKKKRGPRPKPKPDHEKILDELMMQNMSLSEEDAKEISDEECAASSIFIKPVINKSETNVKMKKYSTPPAISLNSKFKIKNCYVHLDRNEIIKRRYTYCPIRDTFTKTDNRSLKLIKRYENI